MAHREFKDRLYAQFARIGSALASPRRLELLDLLTQGERSVEGLAHEAGLTIGAASQHLQVLREANLVATDKRGLRVFYRIAAPEVAAMWQCLRTAGESQLADIDRLVDRYLGQRQTMESLTRDEMMRRLREGTVIVIDARPLIEYRQGHIPGALSIPTDELQDRMRELQAGKDVVAYCRGPYCVYADETVEFLTSKRRRAVRLTDGFPEWAAAGLPAAVGEEPGSL